MSERITQRKGRGQRGASMIEFVIVMGLLLFLLFGIMEFGFMMSSALTVNSAAHQGARAAALNKDWSTAVDDGLDGLALVDNLGVPRRSVALEYGTTSGGTTTWSSTAPTTLTSDHQVRITVTYDYRYITGSTFGALSNLISGKTGAPTTQRNLIGSATMRYGG